MHCAERPCQEVVGKKKNTFDSLVTRVPKSPAWLLLFWWAMMKAQVDVRKTPPPLCRSTLSFCGFLLAQEWRLTVWLLGTAGQCSQSSVCSLACRAPRVSLAPEGETNKKAPLSQTLKLLSNTFVFSTLWGTILFLGEQWQKETRFLFLKQGLRIANPLLFWAMYFFSQFKCHFELLLVVMFFFLLLLFALCFSSPFV